jgi:predicted dehydrogenase
MSMTTKSSRRKFLQSTAVTVGAALFLPSRLLGSEAPSRTIQLAYLGSGNRARTTSKAFLHIPGVRVVGCCDPWAEKSENFKKHVDSYYRTKDFKIYSSYREVLADPSVDAVYIATPDHWHALMAIEAAQAGKHIYIEKPLSFTIEEGQAVVEAVRKNGVICQHGTQQRSLPTFNQAAYLAERGSIGKLHTGVAISPDGQQGGDPTPIPVPAGLDYDSYVGPAPKRPYLKAQNAKGVPMWYFLSQYSHGWLTAWGAHHVDSTVMLLGKDKEWPVKIEGRGEYPQKGAMDTALKWCVEMTYADGVKLIYKTPRYDGKGHLGNAMAIGTQGFVAANREKLFTNPGHLTHQAFPAEDPTFRYLQGDKNAHYENFIAAIREGVQLSAPVELGHLTTGLCHLSKIAIDLQRPLKWDGAQQRFVGDDQANRLLSRPMRPPYVLS